MLKDFKAFVLRGNVIDLAIGVAIGAAFTAVITAFTQYLLTPLLAIPGDAASFAELDFEVSGSRFRYGAFLDAVVSFLLVAAVLFFLVVRPVNALMARRKTEPEVASTTRDCPECLSSIPSAARRCAFCTAEVAGPASGPVQPT
ncbi:MAG: large conductance mechanosensitive channel protein MscL [Actinomycetota bacterium]|nr:large conductance mechanosensitive channel protein MscL [Actinomycetota bacterium]